MFESKSPNPMIEGLFDVSAAEVHQKMADVHLVDVRRPDEWEGELSYIPEAQLLTMETIDEHLEEIPKDKTLVIVCRSGQRSAKVGSFLKMNGFGEVYNMAGGMLAWNDEGFKTAANK